MERDTLLQKVRDIRLRRGYVDVVELARDLGIDIVGVSRPYDNFSFALEPKGADYASQTLTTPFHSLTQFLISYYDIPPDR